MDKVNRRQEPTLEQLQKELKRAKYHRTYWQVFCSTFIAWSLIAAITLLVFNTLVVFKIHGTSMMPTLHDGDIVIALQDTDCSTGDLMAFIHGDKVLVERAIGFGGDVIDIAQDNTVSVNGRILTEEYALKGMLETMDIELPYTVPDNMIFMLGDHRKEAVDSRSTSLGCVTEEQLIGKVVLCVWPLESFSILGERR